MARHGHPCVLIPLTDPIVSPDASSPLTLSPTHRQLTQSVASSVPRERGITANNSIHVNECAPLLDASASRMRRREQEKKPFYRPRPLWYVHCVMLSATCPPFILLTHDIRLVPFALLSSLAHGMAVAPRVDVYTQLACAESQLKHPGRFDYSIDMQSLTPVLLSNETTASIPSPTFASIPADTYIHGQFHSTRSCSTSPSSAIQARAARIQTTMTTTVGLLSALTTAWWGQFGERHGRMSVLAIASVGLLIT